MFITQSLHVMCRQHCWQLHWIHFVLCFFEAGLQDVIVPIITSSSFSSINLWSCLNFGEIGKYCSESNSERLQMGLALCYKCLNVLLLAIALAKSNAWQQPKERAIVHLCISLSVSCVALNLNLSAYMMCGWEAITIGTLVVKGLK